MLFGHTEMQRGPEAIDVGGLDPRSVLHQHVSHGSGPTHGRPVQRRLPRVVRRINVATVLDDVERDVGVVVERGPLERVVAVAVGLPERGGGSPLLHETAEPLQVPIRRRRVHVHHGVRLPRALLLLPPPLLVLVPPAAFGYHLDLRHEPRTEEGGERGS